MIKVLVTGGRNYENRRFVSLTLGKLHREQGISEIIEGGASGADAFAAGWAKANGLEPRTFDAEWGKYKKPGQKNPAGPIRNQRMLDEAKPDLVVAFPGGSGTANMIKLARKAGVRVMEVKES